MKIARLNGQTAPQIAEIERLCFVHPWSLDSINSRVNNENALFFTAEIDGKIAGYIGMDRVLDEGYIANVAVLPEYRRQGVASRLLSHLIELSREQQMSFLTLEVRKSNSAAISLYHRFGFEEVGERKNYYSSPTENAVIMTYYFNRS